MGQVAELRLRAGDQTATGSVVVGSTVSGVGALNPSIVEEPADRVVPEHFGLLLLILVSMVAVGLLVYGVIMLFIREDRLASVLSPTTRRSRRRRPTTTTTSEHIDGTHRADATSGPDHRAGRDRPRGARPSGECPGAGQPPVAAAEGLLVYASGVVLFTVFALILTGSLIVGLILGVFAAIIPVAVVNYLAARRRKQFMAFCFTP